jgi:hypothetical protein
MHHNRRVAFATTVWEGDYREILLDSDYLEKKMIGHHCFPFWERILVVNNVTDRQAVHEAARPHLEAGTLTRVVDGREGVERRFGIEQFQSNQVPLDWLIYNARGPLTALDVCRSEFLLYQTGDVYLAEPVDWITEAILGLDAGYKVANLTWNNRYDEAKKESSGRFGPFYVASEGFSDQQFLVRTADFGRPIYSVMREDAAHYPRGDVFEARAFSAMKMRGWKRLIYRKGSYTHENFRCRPSLAKA